MMNELTSCPSTLAKGYSTYSPIAMRKLFEGKKVSPILPYQPMARSVEDATAFLANTKYISISGVQNKYGLVVNKDKLVLTSKNEQSTYILKPQAPSLRLSKDIPANENLTMQIAEQVFNLETAANGLCFFADGEIAYITKRFDVAKEGTKLRMEDFASLAGIASGEGSGAKYDYSYEEIANLIKAYIPAWRVELVKFFRQVLFNFLFSNGDAHLKNFAVLETPHGDFKLSPAYDLLNTRLHVDDADFALQKGLFQDTNSSLFKTGTQANGATFKAFGLKIGLLETIVARELAFFTEKHLLIEKLITQSFLEDKTKRVYLMHYQNRRNRLADFKL